MVRARPGQVRRVQEAVHAELKDPDHAEALDHRGAMAKKGTLTLLTASKRDDISEATVLADLLNS